MTTASMVSCALCLALVLPAAHAQPAATAGWTELARMFDEGVAKDGTVGASIAMVKGGAVVARRDHGLADRDLKQRVDEKTLFHWGSITKILTAIAIHQLVERRKIALDDRIVRWVPELRQLHDPFNAIDAITLRMLLSHTAGFQGPTWPYRPAKPWAPFEPTSWAQLVAMMPYQELAFRPGSKYGYSNPAFIYLARVIEAVSGDSWQVYVQKNIFAPLGLTNSYFGATPYHLAADRANSYLLKRDARGAATYTAYGRDFDPGITIPNSGWNAPVADLAKFVTFLSGAATDPALRRRHELVLPPKVLEEMWRPIVATGGDSGWMGQSFFVAKPGAPAIVGHTGSQAGFVAFFYLNPRTATAIIAAFNTNSAPALSSFSTLNTASRALLAK